MFFEARGQDKCQQQGLVANFSKGNHPAREAVYHAGITEIQVVQPLDTTSAAAKHLAEHGPGGGEEQHRDHVALALRGGGPAQRDDLLARVPQAAQNRACICLRCVLEAQT